MRNFNFPTLSSQFPLKLLSTIFFYFQFISLFMKIHSLITKIVYNSSATDIALKASFCKCSSFKFYHHHFAVLAAFGWHLTHIKNSLVRLSLEATSQLPFVGVLALHFHIHFYYVAEKAFNAARHALNIPFLHSHKEFS